MFRHMYFLAFIDLTYVFAFLTYGHLFFVLCPKSNTPRMAKNGDPKNVQKALNHDLRLPSYSTRRELPESSRILEKGWICVELWPFYCSKRISVPMSYISSWDIRVYLNLRVQVRMPIFKKKSRRLEIEFWHWQTIVQVLGF